MKKRLAKIAQPLALAALFSVHVGASGAGGPERPRFAATIPPVAAILAEIVGTRADVTFLLPAGASPHTHEPRPSDIRRVEEAVALVHVGENLDGWAARLPGPPKIGLLALVPDSLLLDFPIENGEGSEGAHGHGIGTDPHFWTDPIAVRAIVPLLAERLAGLDPAGAGEYRANARDFSERLDSLHAEVGRRIAPAQGRSVLLSHPVLCYFLHRYEIRLAGVIEWVEGREPTAKDVRSAIERASSERAAAVFAPPELSRRAAEIVAEAAGLEVRIVDPLGETAGPGTYEKLLMAIADTIAAGTK